jgi:hypothetical protein
MVAGIKLMGNPKFNRWGVYWPFQVVRLTEDRRGVVQNEYGPAK